MSTLLLKPSLFSQTVSGVVSLLESVKNLDKGNKNL